MRQWTGMAADFLPRNNGRERMNGTLSFSAKRKKFCQPRFLYLGNIHFKN